MKPQTAIAKVMELYDQERKFVEYFAKNAVSCGAINLDEYPEDEYALPKIMIHVIFLTLADGYKPLSKEHREEVKNLALHI